MKHKREKEKKYQDMDGKKYIGERKKQNEDK